MFIRLDVIHERDGQTDGRTETLHDSKDRAYASHRAVKTNKTRNQYASPPECNAILAGPLSDSDENFFFFIDS